MPTDQAPPRILFMTVGTGNKNNLEDTLFKPLRMSAETGTWDLLVLLPSTLTEDNAKALADQLRNQATETKPLPAGAENDVDQTYAHFDAVIAEVSGRFAASSPVLEADFTRGTKVMSAALTLAALRHDIPHLRYIEGERDEQGMVISGTERIRQVNPRHVLAQRRLDEAGDLFRRGNFTACQHLIGDPDNPFFAARWIEAFQPRATVVYRAAAFFAAWDRFDYRAARDLAKTAQANPMPEGWEPLAVTEAMAAWIDRLAQGLPEADDPDRMAKRAAHVRALAADVLANGERRIAAGQFEDAVVRGYRVLEMVGQARLFDHGLDSASLPANHEVVEKLAADMKKKGTQGFGENNDGTGTLNAPRDKVNRLLGRLKDPLAPKLKELAENGPFPAKVRNTSLLIHGFASTAPEEESLRDLYTKLAALLVEDGGEDSRSRLEIARAPAFGS